MTPRTVADQAPLSMKLSSKNTGVGCMRQACTSPGWMHETSAQTWCTGKTSRDQVEREVGGGIGMGNTCKPMAVSFQCMTKSTTIKKKKKRILEWVAIFFSKGSSRPRDQIHVSFVSCIDRQILYQMCFCCAAK